MRTKQAEEREVQERTWIYLLHDQAPPTHTRNVTPAVLAARSAGVLGDGAIAPTLPSMSAATASPAHYHNHNSGAVGPYIRQQQPPSHHLQQQQQQQHASPYMTSYHGTYDAYGRPLAPNNSASAGYAYNPYTNAPSGGVEYMSKQPTATPRPMSSVVTASDKWQSPYQQQHTSYQQPMNYQSQQFHTQQTRGLEFPPLRAMLSKSDKLPFTPAAHTSAVPGPIVVKSEVQPQPSMMLTKPAKKKSPAAASSMLPKKRRHDELDEVFVAPSTLDELEDDDDDDDETKASKRNCFPKKCDFPMCKNSSRSRGFCYSHGGGRRCRMDGCNNGAVSRDLCKRHGGGRRCRISGCKSSSESGGLCYSHGGGRRCSLSWCSARAKKGGLCAVHIGNENAEPPTESEEAATAASTETVAEPAAVESKAAPTAAEMLLSLAHVQSSSATSGDVSPTSPSLPELSTPRFSSIASLLN